MKLGLGTVQFGSDYGISNRAGRTPQHDVVGILQYAASVGIEVIDTAAAYGDAEAVLGEALPGGSNFRIVTKIALHGTEGGVVDHGSVLRRTFSESLSRLRLNSIYGVLLHRVEDVLGANGSTYIEALLALKRDRLVQKIGVSVYGPDQLEMVLSRFVPDIVQLPCNVLDQRLFQSGWLSRLRALGAEIHIRSVFLQGLLLMDDDRRPSIFSDYEVELARFTRFCAHHRLTPLQAALGYVRQLPGDVMIVGVTRHAELEQIVQASRITPPTLAHYAELACTDENLVNPSKWRAH